MAGMSAVRWMNPGWPECELISCKWEGGSHFTMCWLMTAPPDMLLKVIAVLEFGMGGRMCVCVSVCVWVGGCVCVCCVCVWVGGWVGGCGCVCCVIFGHIHVHAYA